MHREYVVFLYRLKPTAWRSCPQGENKLFPISGVFFEDKFSALRGYARSGHLD